MQQQSPTPYIEICFRPNVEMISSARRFVATIYEPFLGDGDTASRAAMVAHELLENALKYSVDGHTVIRIQLSRAHPPLTLVVETRSRIAPERRKGLDEAFAPPRTRTTTTSKRSAVRGRSSTVPASVSLGSGPKER